MLLFNSNKYPSPKEARGHRYCYFLTLTIILAQRKLEEDTAVAVAQQEHMTRQQKETHARNKELADNEFSAAKAAENEADKAIKYSKVFKQNILYLPYSLPLNFQLNFINLVKKLLKLFT